VRPATQLIEQGIKAYTRGALEDAERCWREALALEPMNDRARAYLELLSGARGGGAPLPVPPEPVAIPPPPAAAPAPALPRYSTPPAGMAVALPEPPRGPPPEPMPEPAQEPPVRPLQGPVTLLGGEPYPGGGREDGRPSTLSEYVASPWDQGPAQAASIVLEPDEGMDLHTLEEKSEIRSLVPDQGQPPAAPPRAHRPVSDVDVWMQGAKELHALGDFSGSLEMIEKILKVNPSHAEARGYLQQNEATLIAMYESKLGSMARIPRLAIKPEEVLWLNLDHRAGFLLAQIDGAVNFEDLSGLPRLDTARILATLLQEGVVTS
jgi:tetratricopeptide (TPR) repeat protein